jgi:hypothetical protein
MIAQAAQHHRVEPPDPGIGVGQVHGLMMSDISDVMSRWGLNGLRVGR